MIWPFQSTIYNRWGEGTPYLHRWMLLPKNRWFNVYLHLFSGPDDVTYGLHDHPWDFIAITLRGSGYESLFFDQRSNDTHGIMVISKPLSRIRFNWAEKAHAILNVSTVPRLLTLVIHGPRRRQWGFYSEYGWIHHNQTTEFDGRLSY